MANVIYDNFFLSNLVEDQYNSHLDLQQFCTVDNSLEGVPGMIRKINVYSASDGTEKLAKGEGNTKSIEVGFTQKSYTIQLAQNRFRYFDEEAMTDPMVVPVGMKHAGTDLFNTVNGDIYGEYLKAPMVVLATYFDFDSVADAQSMFNLENIEDVRFFAFVAPGDVPEIRKKLKDTLQYVTEFARNGYVGTVGGVNFYTKKDATPGTVVIATKEAVTIFNKKGTEVEQSARSEDEANVRKNTVFSRKYYVVALTDETKAVKVMKGTAALSVDTEVDENTTYYEKSGLGYIAVTPKATDNPVTKGWYEITPANP